MRKVKGIVLYNIELNGNLSGVYTNDDPALKGKIFTEIASRNPAKDVPSKGECYDTLYFDSGPPVVACLLFLDLQNGKYTALWEDNNSVPKYKGVGYRMNERQIAIAYESA